MSTEAPCSYLDGQQETQAAMNPPSAAANLARVQAIANPHKYCNIVKEAAEKCGMALLVARQ